jgi:two-component system chemotaxis sensor kinase CheA
MSQAREQSIIDEFIAESCEHLDAIEPHLLALEQECEQVPLEIVNRVFRAAHSIKGASGFHSFKPITKLSHMMEGVLDLFLKGKTNVDVDKVDALLAGMDKLRAMIEAPQSCDQVPFGDELDRLKAILDEHRTVPQKSPEHAPESNAEPKKESKAKIRGMTFSWVTENDKATELRKTTAPRDCPEGQGSTKVELNVAGPPPLGMVSFEIDPQKIAGVPANMEFHAAWVYPESDLKKKGRNSQEFLTQVASFGECLASNMNMGSASERGDKPENDVYCVLIATILEPDLMSEVLDIPPEQMSTIESSAVEEARAQASMSSTQTDPPKPSCENQALPRTLDNSLAPTR